jgi:hypothetical protein
MFTGCDTENESPKVGKLTDQQRVLYRHCVERIKNSLLSQEEALYQIHSQRLYRETHNDFDAYLADCWPEIDRSTAYRKINSGAVNRVLEEHAPELPKPSQEAAQVLHRAADPVGIWRECAKRGWTSNEGVKKVLAEQIQPQKVEVMGNPNVAKINNRVEIHVPPQFEQLVQESFGCVAKPQGAGRIVLRRSVSADEAADFLIEIGECFRDNKITPFSLRIAL